MEWRMDSEYNYHNLVASWHRWVSSSELARRSQGTVLLEKSSMQDIFDDAISVNMIVTAPPRNSFVHPSPQHVQIQRPLPDTSDLKLRSRERLVPERSPIPESKPPHTTLIPIHHIPAPIYDSAAAWVRYASKSKFLSLGSEITVLSPQSANIQRLEYKPRPRNN